MNAAAKTNQALSRGLSIIVADDDPDTVATLGAILADEGHTVHTVTHGGLVLEAVRRFKPNVCIIDIEMPGQDGYAIARDLVTEFGDRRPHLIGISGRWKTQTDVMLAKLVGFDNFFTKPADPRELIKLLSSVEPDAA